MSVFTVFYFFLQEDCTAGKSRRCSKCKKAYCHTAAGFRDVRVAGLCFAAVGCVC